MTSTGQYIRGRSYPYIRMKKFHNSKSFTGNQPLSAILSFNSETDSQFKDILSTINNTLLKIINVFIFSTTKVFSQDEV